MRKAFTLVELIIFMGIFSILIFIISDLFVNSLKAKSQGESVAVVNQDADFVLAKLEYDLHQGYGLTQPSLGLTGSSVSFLKGGEQITYRLSGNNLERVIGTDVQVLNSYRTRITTAEFTNIGNATGKSTVKIAITFESTTLTEGKPEVISLDTTVGLR